MCHISAVPRPSSRSTPNARIHRSWSSERQRLTRGCRETQDSTDPLTPRPRMGHHLLDHRRHVDEDRRPVSRDLREQYVGRAALGKQDARRADRERKEHIRSGGVAEKQLGHRDRHVVRTDAEHAVAIQLCRVDERTMCLHDALGPPGRAPAEQPDRRIVSMGIKGFEFGGLRLQARRRARRFRPDRVARADGSPLDCCWKSSSRGAATNAAVALVYSKK